MKLDKEFLQKNRFWVLLSCALVLWLAGLGVVIISGAAAAKAREEVKKAEDSYGKQNNPKNARFNEPWDERRKFYEGQKDSVWKQAWDTQSNLMTWPAGRLANYSSKYFGDPIDVADINQYRETDYKTQFLATDGKNASRDTLLNGRFLPVAFDDNKIIAPVDWTTSSDKNVTQPTPEEVWLAQEDLWVRREMLLILHDALSTIGKFTEIRERDWDRSPDSLLSVGGGLLDAAWKKDARLYKKRPLTEQQQKDGIIASRLFRNHNWQVELLIKQDGNKTFISADSTITNTNVDGRALALVTPPTEGLWLQLRQGKANPNLKRISGRLLQPGEWVPFGKTTEINTIDFTKEFELYEMFDRHTSPIRQLEALEVGKPALAHRHGLLAELTQSRFAPTGTAGVTGGAGASGGAGGGAGAMGGNTPAMGAGGGASGIPQGGGSGAPPGVGAQGGAGGQGAAKTNLTPYGINRDRYALCTETVRRLPVAMVVSMDQSHRNALMTAIANSRLRIQTTQVYWRHREPVKVVLSGYKPPDGGSGFGTPPGVGPGTGSGSGRPPMGGSGSGAPPPMGGSGAPPPMGGSGAPPPMGGSGAPPPMGGSGNPPVGGGGNPPMGGGGGKDTYDGQSESGHNMIELTIHGVAALFERFPPAPKTNPTGSPTGQPIR